MKKRIFSLALALVLLLVSAVPVLASEEPELEYRLAKVVYGGNEYTFAYGQGGYLPTEVFRNGSSYKTFSYDEAGRITSYESSDESDTYAYDENGNMVENIATFVYDTGETTTMRDVYTYDDAGNLIREEVTGGSYSSVIECAYDAMGSLTRRERTANYADGTVETSVDEYTYTYDEAGNCIREERTSDTGDGPTTDITEYTYDEEGRILNRVKTGNDGAVSTFTYTYSEDGRTTAMNWGDGNTEIEYNVPLLDVNWQHIISNYDDGTSYTSSSCSFILGDSYPYIFNTSISSDSEPTMTYDDNGYLVKAVGTEGDTIELTYEPVA